MPYATEVPRASVDISTHARDRDQSTSQEFVFTARDQEFYAERGFTEPKRCTPCRNARKAQREGGSAGGGFGGYTGGSSYSAGGYGAPRAPRGPRELHPATCSDCGKETMVPFLPTSGKPVYCDNCFSTRRPAR